MTSEQPPDPEVSRLIGWASGLPRAEQDRLLLALTNLLGSDPLGRRSCSLLDELLPALAVGADASTRAEVAERLLDVSWAPQSLLAALIAEADEAKRLELAGRSAPEDKTAAILLDLGSRDMVLALAGNPRARLGPPSFDRLVELARTQAALRAPLARRRDLRAPHAAELAAMSSPPLRRRLQARFGLSVTVGRSAATVEAARSVVAKLGRSRRLTPGYALGALRAGRLEVFREAMATLGGFPEGVLREPGEMDDPVPLALACVAGGIDRAVFPEVLRGVQALNEGRPRRTGADDSSLILAALARAPQDAARALRDGHFRRAARWSAP